MSSSFATVSEFECSKWGCNRVATQYNFRTEPSYRDKGKTMAELFAANIYCNIHAGAIKRQKTRQMNGRNPQYYANENLVLISELGSHWDEAKQAYLDARLAVAQERRAANEAARAEASLKAQARFAEAWVERSTEPPFSVTRGSDRRSYDGKFIDGFTVMRDGDTPNSWSTLNVDVEQEGRAPAVVNMRSSQRMSPNQARALAQALVLAANLADERDITNGPEVN